MCGKIIFHCNKYNIYIYIIHIQSVKLYKIFKEDVKL